MISIIVPVHNAEHTIENCVNSLISQEYHDLEVILVENGSQDDSYIKCCQLSEKYRNVSCFQISKIGVSAARNEGLRKANGDIIGFCDADDTYEPYSLEYISKAFKKSKADLIITGYYNVTPDKRRIPRLLNKTRHISINELSGRVLNDPRVMGSVCNKFYKKKILEGCFFREDISYCEDTHFNMHLFKVRNNIDCLYLSKITYDYIQRADSATNDTNKLFDENDRLKYIITIKEILKHYSDNERVKEEIRYAIANLAIGSLHDLQPDGKRKVILEKEARDNKRYYFRNILKYNCKHNLKMCLWWVFLHRAS